MSIIFLLVYLFIAFLFIIQILLTLRIAQRVRYILDTMVSFQDDDFGKREGIYEIPPEKPDHNLRN